MFNVGLGLCVFHVTFCYKINVRKRKNGYIQFYWTVKVVYMEENIDLQYVNDRMYHIMLC